MSLDAKGLPERFFSLFPRYKQREIAECLYPGEDGSKKQPQISKWMKGSEPIPMEALDRVVDLGLANWDWLLTGHGGEEPFHDILSGEESQTPPAEASGEQMKNQRTIKAVFGLAGVLAELGQHLVDGKSLDTFSMPPGLRDTLQVLRERRRVAKESNEAQNQSGRTA